MHISKIISILWYQKKTKTNFFHAQKYEKINTTHEQTLFCLHLTTSNAPYLPAFPCISKISNFNTIMFSYKDRGAYDSERMILPSTAPRLTARAVIPRLTTNCNRTIGHRKRVSIHSIPNILKISLPLWKRQVLFWVDYSIFQHRIRILTPNRRNGCANTKRKREKTKDMDYKQLK